MSEQRNNGSETTLTTLESRVERLEAGPTWRSVVALFVSSLVFPLVLLLINHFYLARPAESSQFQARFEHTVNKDGHSEYVLTIMNTGLQWGTEKQGTALLEFPSPITRISRISVPHSTTYGSLRSHDSNACRTEEVCDIGWGALGPEGTFAIGFVTPRPPKKFPSATYGGYPISSWSCAGLPPVLTSNCAPNELSP